MSLHDCFETGVHRLIRLRARTFFFRRSSFLLARINARPQIFDSSPGAPNHLPNSAQWQFFWLVLLTTVPQLSELKRRRKNVWRDVDLNPGPLPLPLDLRLLTRLRPLDHPGAPLIFILMSMPIIQALSL